jgi:tripartite-type tricarboxylate transporter receptor subunit TctC
MKKLLLSIMVAVCISTTAQTTEMIVTFTPGGANDTFARATQQYLREQIGTNSVIVNRPGAEGRIGVKYAAQKSADGNSLLVISTGTFLFSRVLYRNLDYNIHDFDTVVPIVTTPIAISVSGASSIMTFQDFVTAAKSRPVNCGISNTASMFTARYLVKQLGLTNLEIIPYKGGGDVVVALQGNNVECAIEPQFVYRQPHMDRRIRILATTDNDVEPGLGSVALIKNYIPGFVFQTWYGIGILKNTPDSTKAPVIDALKLIHRDERFKTAMNLANLRVREYTVPGNRFLDAEYQRWDRIREELGIAKTE